MKINLREEETNNYITLFSEYIEDVQGLNDLLISELNDVMAQSEYDKLQRLISALIDQYKEVVEKNIKVNLFGVWEESRGSLRSCLKNYRAGDSADTVGAQIEEKLSEMTTETLRIQKGEMLIAERPVVSEDGFDRLKEACKKSRAELQSIKAAAISKVNENADENEIYSTLAPLIEGISGNMESFLDISLNRFDKLHDNVKDFAVEMRKIAEENAGLSNSGTAADGAVGAAVGAVVSVGVVSAKALSGSGKIDSVETLPGEDGFKKLTKYIYNKIFNEMSSSDKTITYDMVEKITVYYKEFYREFGNDLKDGLKTQDEREQKIKKIYIPSITQRGNDKFFDNGNEWTFYSNAQNSYIVFEHAADMLKNIASACKKGNATDTNLVYGSQVLFTPIIEGEVESDKKYSEFSDKAVKEIKKILGINIDDEPPKLSEERKALIIRAMELAIEDVGVDKLNEAVEQIGDQYIKAMITLLESYGKLSSTNKSSRKESSEKSDEKKSSDSKKYGRYTVTPLSIQNMKSEYEKMAECTLKIDSYYKKQFSKKDENFTRLDKTVKLISSIVTVLGSSKKGSSYSDTSSAEKLVSITDVFALLTGDVFGNIVTNASKIWEAASPLIKSSKMLARVSDKMWNITNKNLNLPYWNNYVAQYYFEHYSIKQGVSKYAYKQYAYFHAAVEKIDAKDDETRLTFENAIFAADLYAVLPIVHNNNTKETLYGLYLNLVRSGLCSAEGLNDTKANELTDLLYNIYKTELDFVPNVSVNPDNYISTLK